MHEPHATLIAVDRIRVRPGHNPRRFFARDAFARLVETIRTDGVLTAITVRATDDDAYELIAGERRLRAAREIGLPSIPATIVEADDVTAQRMALVENLDRRDLSVAEEAYAARSFVDSYGGDHAAAAAALGWTPAKLRHRLQLLHADDAVMQALMEDQIAVGHAELLSTLPAETQLKVLARVIESGASIAMLKEQLEGVSLPLDQAVFDKADCRLCPSNSETQAGLFDSAISAGRCANRGCYSAKSRDVIEARREQLREEYPAVSLLTEKQPGTTIPLVLVGPHGVGPTQMAAGCRGCAHYGATVDDRLGPTLGRIEKPLCFNLSCHGEKVAAYAAACAPSTPAAEPDAPPLASASVATHTTAAPAHSPTRAPAPSAARAVPSNVVEQYNRVLRDAVLHELSGGGVEVILAMAVYALAQEGAHAACVGLDEMLEGLGLPRKVRGGTQAMVELAALDKVTLQNALRTLALRYFTTNPEKVAFNGSTVKRHPLAAAMARQAGYDLLPHVRIDRAFLETHTKSALELLMEEAGFKAFYEQGEQGAKRYKALLAMKKDDMIAAILAAGFDFSRYLPSALLAHQSTLAEQAKKDR